MRWLYTIPTWSLALLIVSSFLAISLLGLAFTQRRLHRSGSADSLDNGTVGWFFLPYRCSTDFY